MKNYKQYNESLRDKMTPKSEEDIRNVMGEEKYTQYEKLSEIKEIMNKIPFLPSDVYIHDDPMVVKIFSELDDFIIKYIDNKYILNNNEIDVYSFNTTKELIEKIKEISFKGLEEYVKEKNKDIDKIKEEISNIEEDFSHINKNF